MNTIINKIYEKGKNEKDDEILNNIFMLEKNKDKLFKFSEEPTHECFYIGNNSFLKTPTEKSDKIFLIISPQTVEKDEGGIGLIIVDKEKAAISFFGVNTNNSELLFNASFDSNTFTWDVRNQISEEKNKPSNIDSTLDEIENNKVLGVDGLLYSETIRGMISEIMDSYKTKESIIK